MSTAICIFSKTSSTSAKNTFWNCTWCS